ncbi:MAG TPA: hypothetical protein VG735_07885 [Caulobacterales bacterium]|nr:hypothetical protein [Caulobacterales bacterium]
MTDDEFFRDASGARIGAVMLHGFRAGLFPGPAVALKVETYASLEDLLARRGAAVQILSMPVELAQQLSRELGKAALAGVGGLPGEPSN